MHVSRCPRGCGAAGAALLLALAAPLGAEDYSGSIGVQAGAGVGLYTGGNLDHTDPGPFLHAGVRLGLKRRLDILASIRYGSFPATGLPDSFATSSGMQDSTRVDLQYDNQTTQFELGVLYNFRPEEKWTLQTFAGAGVTLWEVVDLTGKSGGLFASGDVLNGFKEDGFEETLSDQNVHLYYGLAAEFEVYRRASLQIGARIDWLLVQDADNAGASAAANSPAWVDANEFLGTLFASISYAITARDGDGDRIADGSDACPLEAEDLDGFQDYDGCPDPDNDEDGVQDAQDRCPETPRGARVDSLGCPVQARPDTLREAQPDTLRQGMRRVPGGEERFSLRSSAGAELHSGRGKEFSPLRSDASDVFRDRLVDAAWLRRPAALQSRSGASGMSRESNRISGVESLAAPPRRCRPS